MADMKVNAAVTRTITQLTDSYEYTQKKEENVGKEKVGDKNYQTDAAATYEKSNKSDAAKDPYKIAKKSSAERAEIVEKMKAAEQQRTDSLTEMVRKMISSQADVGNKANGNPFFSGTVGAEAIRKAKEDISEDGYYGVKQTSRRLFDFAMALAGDDVEKMQKMQKAMNKGIGQAASKLGGLPSICQETQEAANKLFDDYYESKGIKSEEGR